MKHSFFATMLGAALCALLVENPAIAAPGDLDSSFGTQGIALAAIGDEGAVAMALQADGRILTATIADAGADRSSLRITRFTTGGIVDATFGSGGIASIPIDVDKLSVVHTMLRQNSDSKLVVGGRSVHAFALVRLTTTGTLDSTFGNAGTATTVIGGDDEAFALAQQTDGRIVAVGKVDDGSDSDFAVVRYTTGGLPDTLFSGDGIATVEFGGSDVAHAVVVQGDGAIVVAGVTQGSNGDIALARLTSTGTLDSTFGTGGKLTTTVTARDDAAYALLLQADNKIVIAGVADDDFVVVRYLSDGQLDTGFGTGGITKTNVSAGTLDEARTIVRQGDHKLIAGGVANPFRAGDLAVVRYTTAGQPDSTFGSGGIVTTSVAAIFDEEINALLLQTDGKLLAAGLSEDGSTTYQMISRYITAAAPSCGNAVVESPEQCDLGAGNGTSGSCCSAGCTLIASGTACRAAVGSCDQPETCTGSTSTCPANSFFASTTICRAAAGVCDQAETCSGSSATCPANAFLASTAVCRAGSGDVCDPAEKCTGSSLECPNNLVSLPATICRAAVGVCDEAETCSGIPGQSCPNDKLATFGTVCTEDGNVCTDNACDGFGACSATNNTSACDDGNACSATDVCSAGTCTGSGSVCGNGNIDPRCGESCDDGNTSNTDACLNSCAAAACGDGFVRFGIEQCDDGNTSNTDACVADCLMATCGDAFVRIGFEGCDDSNTTGGDGCSGTCQLESCDNGVLDAGEQCDDGNTDDTDGCLHTCAFAFCGDGFVRAGVEQCDDGNTAAGDGCSPGCSAEVICGDADLNGSVSASDALRVLRRAVGQAVTCPPYVCDVDANGQVQATDALKVLRKAVGQGVALVCPAAAG